jgi:hypothetical protein
MSLTESEVLFEEYCKKNSLDIRRVKKPCFGGKYPDYLLWLSRNRIIVEVKQFNESPLDIDLQKQLIEKGKATFIEPGVEKRVSNKIHDAMAQLKRYAKGKHPAIVVLYNNSTFFGSDKNEIRIAMYGKDIVDFMV